MALGGYLLIEKINKPIVENKVVTIEAPPKAEMLVLWKVKRKLNKGDPIYKELFERVMIAKLEAKERYGVSSDVSLILSRGSIVNRALADGEIVLPEYISYPKEPGYLNLLIPENKVIYSIQVLNRNLIPSYIKIGDLVDIISIRSLTENIAETDRRIRNIDQLEAKVLKRRAKVLYLEQRDGNERLSVLGGSDDPVQFDGNDDLPLSDLRVNEGESLMTIVLAVDSHDVARLSLAQKIGQLEVYPSQTSNPISSASIRDVIENTGTIRELRGGSAAALIKNSEMVSDGSTSK